MNRGRAVRLTNPRDLVAAALVLGVGLLFVVHGFSYPMGSARRMGAGFFPVLLGILAMGLSLPLALRAFTVVETAERAAWRPFLAVVGGVAAFAAALPTLGLGPALVLTVMLATLGDERPRLVDAAMLAVGLAVGAWAIFIVGLGLPIGFIGAAF
jgi:hypothetical protein